MMHLAINGSDLGRQRGGNESFILGLLRGMEEAHLPIHTTVLASSAGAKVLSSVDFQGDVFDYGSYHNIKYHFWQQSRILRRIHPDWYLSTYFLPPGLPCPGAVIVHDVSFSAHPEYFPFIISCYMRILTGRAIQRAQVVALDSWFTAREVARYYSGIKDKGVITNPGLDPRFLRPMESHLCDSILAQYHLRPGYILAIGNIHPRKNLGRLLDAYLLLRDALPSCPPMVWIGLPRWKSASLIKRAGAAGVILPGYVQAEHLPAIYQSAGVFVYPSLYEGFGLPVLEAMASGTPVICSNTTSLPEVAGDAALLVDPLDTSALCNALFQLLSDDALAEDFRKRGLNRVAGFTYIDTARVLFQALSKSS